MPSVKNMLRKCPRCGLGLIDNTQLRKPCCLKCGPIWICRDLTMIAVVDMDVGHLTNTVEMLRRSAAPRLERNGFDPETDTRRVFPIVDVLEAEIDRRLHRDRGLEEISS